MAKLECEPRGGFFEILGKIDNAVHGSVSASLEDKSDFGEPGERCAVRVYERYSFAGSNRVSLSVTLFEHAGALHLSAITSGGSQAMFFKLNTFGEQAFLDVVRGALDI